MIVLLQIFSWFWQWKNVENRLIFGKVKAYKKLCQFFGPPCIVKDVILHLSAVPFFPRIMLCLCFILWSVIFKSQNAPKWFWHPGSAQTRGGTSALSRTLAGLRGKGRERKRRKQKGKEREIVKSYVTALVPSTITSVMLTHLCPAFVISNT